MDGSFELTLAGCTLRCHAAHDYRLNQPRCRARSSRGRVLHDRFGELSFRGGPRHCWFSSPIVREIAQFLCANAGSVRDWCKMGASTVKLVVMKLRDAAPKPLQATTAHVGSVVVPGLQAATQAPRPIDSANSAAGEERGESDRAQSTTECAFYRP